VPYVLRVHAPLIDCSPLFRSSLRIVLCVTLFCRLVFSWLVLCRSLFVLCVGTCCTPKGCFCDPHRSGCCLCRYQCPVVYRDPDWLVLPLWFLFHDKAVCSFIFFPSALSFRYSVRSLSTMFTNPFTEVLLILFGFSHSTIFPFFAARGCRFQYASRPLLQAPYV